MLVISVLSVNTIYSASLLSQKGSLQAKLPLMLVGAVCLLTSRAEKKVDSKTLQDPYSALCLNWIWVALCLTICIRAIYNCTSPLLQSSRYHLLRAVGRGGGARERQKC